MRPFHAIAEGANALGKARQAPRGDRSRSPRGESVSWPLRVRLPEHGRAVVGRHCRQSLEQVLLAQAFRLGAFVFRHGLARQQVEFIDLQKLQQESRAESPRRSRDRAPRPLSRRPRWRGRRRGSAAQVASRPTRPARAPGPRNPARGTPGTSRLDSRAPAGPTAGHRPLDQRRALAGTGWECVPALGLPSRLGCRAARIETSLAERAATRAV